MLGLIGLGLVGTALCQRFVRSGWTVYGFDIEGEAIDRARRFGAHIADSPADVAYRARSTVLSLPNSDVVQSVVEEAEGMIEGLRSEDLLIDTTTADPLSTVALAERLAQRGVRFVDATILGSSQQVLEGEAVVMAGGAVDDVRDSADVLNAFARQTFHMGTHGKGAEAKLVVNLVLGLNRLVLAEGLVLGEQAGIEPNALLSVLRAGAAYSRAMDHKGQKMIECEFTPQGRLAQHAKDVELMRALAARCGAALPLSSVHAQVLQRAMAEDMGDLDNAAVVQVLRLMAQESGASSGATRY